MRKPSYDGRPFRMVELIAFVALVALAVTFVWPSFERRIMRPVEIATIVRIEPLISEMPKAADALELGEVGRRFLSSPEGINAIWNQVNPGLRPGYQANARLGRWLEERLQISPIKGTFLIRYSCVVEEPEKDLSYLKATVNALVEHMNQGEPLNRRASIADPVVPPRILPASLQWRIIYMSAFAFFAMFLSFAIVKVAQIRDSRPEYAV